jgi:hypothetical protein
MMRLAVRVLALIPGCVLDRTALSRRLAGAFSGGDFPIEKESREDFAPLGIWSFHEMPDQATCTSNQDDAENNKENREQHDPTLLLLYDPTRKANALKVE